MKPLSKEWAKKVIEASKLLEKLYKKGIESKHSCPYCTLFINLEGDCVLCPWTVFKGRECCTCGDTRKEICYENTVPKKRLPRIRGWIKRCENILNK